MNISIWSYLENVVDVYTQWSCSHPHIKTKQLGHFQKQQDGGGKRARGTGRAQGIVMTVIQSSSAIHMYENVMIKFIILHKQWNVIFKTLTVLLVISRPFPSKESTCFIFLYYQFLNPFIVTRKLLFCKAHLMSILNSLYGHSIFPSWYLYTIWAENALKTKC